MSEPVIIVAGFARCGSSLTLQMLAAGGVRCLGNYPAFEDTRTNPPMDMGWLASLGGQAVKVLEPQRHTWPPLFPARFIWLDRDAEEQGKSQAKFLRLMVGMPVPAGYWRSCAESIEADRPVALAALQAWPLLRVQFEAMLANPWAVAEVIASFLGQRDTMNIEQMGQAVRPRHPGCAPGLDMEMTLCAGGQRA